MLTLELLNRFIFVFLLTSLYGLQRQRSHKPVGFGTFILVATGACTMAVLASQMDIEHSIALLSAVVTGIGFLGAGALIKGSDRIFGFTTAASIWFFAIFGLIAGLGRYDLSIVIYIIVWIVVLFDEYMEVHGVGSYRKKMIIHTNVFVKKDEVANLIAKYCTSQTLINVEANKKEKEISLTYLVEGMKKDINGLLKEFYKKRWCNSITLE